MLDIFDLLVRLVLCAVLLERSLKVLFESRPFLSTMAGFGFEELLTFGASVFVCWYATFDLLAVIFELQATVVGILATAAFITGFTGLSQKLFRDFLNIRSDASLRLQRMEFDESERRLQRMEFVESDTTRESLPVAPSVPDDDEAEQSIGKTWATKELIRGVISIGGGITVAVVIAFLGIKT